MKLAIGSDHAGFDYKERIKQFLADLRYVVDFGTDSEKPVDYPLFIRPVALAVASGNADRGVVLGGSGMAKRWRRIGSKESAARCAGALKARDFLLLPGSGRESDGVSG